MTIPVKRNADTGTLYARGVSLTNIKFLKKNFRKQGFRNVGSFINAIIKDAKGRKR